MAAKKKKKKTKSRSRKLAWLLGLVLLGLLALYAFAGVWYVHHSPAWLAQNRASWPGLITVPLSWIGNPLGDITDALDITGEDAVYEFDEDPPSGQVLFAGAPRRTGLPCPADIQIIDRGEFLVGWSPSLRHPVWCAYHVTPEARFEVGPRPNFTKDKSVANSPSASDYQSSGYDRGHMVPNYAMGSRYGTEIQRLTFLMSNIAPQAPALNRGVWRQIEHRIAELWTARYGEIWIIVGCISRTRHPETLSGRDVDVPESFYQVVVAQSGLDVRAFAVLINQNVDWKAWPTEQLITIDELEELSGLDFLPDLPFFIQTPLEAQLPSRLWPINKSDIFKLIALRFSH